MNCPHLSNGTCTLATEIVREQVGLELPILTQRDQCQTCKSRHPEPPTIEHPGTVASSLAISQVRQIDSAAGKRIAAKLARHLKDERVKKSRRGACPTAPPSGPGTEFQAIADSVRMEPKAGCTCEALRQRMNALGVAGCREHREELLAELLENYKRYSVWAKIAAATRATFSSLAFVIDPRDPLGSLFDEAVRRAEAKQRPTGDTSNEDAVAVVIPCHNYGRFLTQCLDSVLQQTHRPAEVLVIDDSSTDDTADIAARYGDRGVQYQRIEAGDVHAARAAGYATTTAPLLCFLDADDWIAPDYFQQAVARLRADWRTAIVYTDLHRFGADTGVRKFPERVLSADLLRHNQIHAGAVVRRQALQIANAFATVAPSQAHADWFLWRRVLAHGWQAVRSPAVYHYRRHPEGSLLTQSESQTWFERYGGFDQQVTLLIPLSGRRWAWPHTAQFLERQTWPRDRLSIVLADTSQAPEFDRELREWIAGCDYDDVRLLRFPFGRPGLADEDRRGRKDVQQDVNLAMCAIWSRLTRGLTTPWAWTLEDDVVPPADVLQRLLSGFAPEVDAVCAPYRSRFQDCWVVRRGDPATSSQGSGLERVTSCGFGCAVFRSQLLRDHTFACPRGRWYDPWFFESRQLHVLCDWNCEAEHLHGPAA